MGPWSQRVHGADVDVCYYGAYPTPVVGDYARTDDDHASSRPPTATCPPRRPPFPGGPTVNRLLSGRVLENPWLQLVLVSAATVALLVFVYLIRDVLLPFFLAFIVAYMLDPPVDWLEARWGLSRVAATFLLLAVLTLVLVLLGYYLTLQAVEFARGFGGLLEELPEALAWIRSALPAPLVPYLDAFLEAGDAGEVMDRTLEFLRDHLNTVADTLTRSSDLLVAFATRTIGVIWLLLNLVVFLFSILYFLRDFDRILEEINRLVPPRYRSELRSTTREINGLMRAFFRGHLIVSLTTGVLYGTGYLLVGLEGGFLVGFLSGLMNVIPYIGPATGFLLAFVLALYQFGVGYWLLAIIGIFVAVQSLEGNVLTPNIVGGAVGLHPVVVIFALMVFGKFFGFLGLLFAIPLAAILKVLLGRLVVRYRESEFYRGTPRSSAEGGS